MIEQVQSRQRICLWKTTLRIRLCPLHSNNALKQKKDKETITTTESIIFFVRYSTLRQDLNV